MRKIETVYRELLFNVIENRKRSLTQAYLARALSISLSTVNLAIKPLERMGAVIIKKMRFDIIDPKKILYYWASIRDIEKDIIYKTRANFPIKDIEKSMPDDAIFSAYSAYKFKFNDVPADYSEVYVYGDESIIKRFPQNDRVPNLFVLKKDKSIENYGKTTTIANLFVDLWNLKEWYAKDFLKALEAKIGRVLE